MKDHGPIPPETQSSKLQTLLRKYAGVWISILLLTTGCDALDIAQADSIFLDTSRVICFEFSGITNGGNQSVVSSDAFDLAAFLSSEGYSASEVLSAEVRDITLRLRFPGQVDLSVFDRASIALRAGSSSITIASSTDLGNSRTLALPATGNNVGNVVTSSSVQGVLDITGAASISDDFLVEVEMDIRVEVEGL